MTIKEVKEIHQLATDYLNNLCEETEGALDAACAKHGATVAMPGPVITLTDATGAPQAELSWSEVA